MVLILRDLQGKSYEEVAAILDLPLGTVKSRVNRARIQLAQVLREYRGGTS
jgi:RNA polymerase sigma-70 factor (ECF subfamily)